MTPDPDPRVTREPARDSFVERFNCPTCQGGIDLASVLVTLHPRAYSGDQRRQRLQMHCEHCTSITTIERSKMWDNSSWQIDAIGPVTKIKQRASILKAIETQRTTSQMGAA